MTPPINIDGTSITGASIDGSDVSSITVDGTQVFRAIPDSVIARWQFNDDSGTTTATDSEGSNDGTINGASYTTTAQEGSNALQFDGTDDDVDVSTVNKIHVGENPPNTVSFVINANSGDTIGNWNGNGWAIVERDNDGDSTSELTWLNRSDGSTFTRSFADVNIFDGNAHHVVVVNNDGSAGNVEFYVDDTKQNTTVDSSGTAVGSSGSLTTKIGQRGDGNRFTDGILDDVMIADDAFSSKDVSDVFSIYNI